MTYLPTVIKSLQRGTITIPANVGGVQLGVAGVDANYANLRYLGARLDLGGTADGLAFIFMASPSVIQANRYDIHGNLTINWELVEYYPSVVSRVQRGNLIANAAFSAAVAIAACNPARSLLHHLGNGTSDVSSGSLADCLTRLELTNASTVTAYSGSVFYQQQTSWELVEFK